MARFGVTLLILAVGSVILNLINVEFVVLMWVDSWGPTVGWIIRGGIAALGLLLIVAGRNHNAD